MYNSEDGNMHTNIVDRDLTNINIKHEYSNSEEKREVQLVSRTIHTQGVAMAEQFSQKKRRGAIA